MNEKEMEELKVQTIKTLEWMTTTIKWQEDQINGNFDEWAQGGYSPELTKAIELLEKWKGV